MKGLDLNIENVKTDDDLELVLAALRARNPEDFDRIVAEVKHKAREPRPLFPPQKKVSSVKPIPESEIEAFKTANIDSTYIHWGTPEADERTIPGSEVRKAQYKRWKWACDNFDTYVNMLRVSGHSDENIQAMIDGRPLCFQDQATHEDLKSALRDLAQVLEKKLGWESVGFIFTGSSVPGFSQNPLKGRYCEPTRITSTSKSDVDISIKADGVEAYVEKLRSDGTSVYGFATTCSATRSGTRFGLKPESLLKTPLADFFKEWSERLPGGLQITFSEDALDIPPWESVVV